MKILFSLILLFCLDSCSQLPRIEVKSMQLVDSERVFVNKSGNSVSVVGYIFIQLDVDVDLKSFDQKSGWNITPFLKKCISDEIYDYPKFYINEVGEYFVLVRYKGGRELKYNMAVDTEGFCLKFMPLNFNPVDNYRAWQIPLYLNDTLVKELREYEEKGGEVRQKEINSK